MLRLIAIAAGLILAARTLARRNEPEASRPEPTDPTHRITEEDVEQELRTSAS